MFNKANKIVTWLIIITMIATTTCVYGETEDVEVKDPQIINESIDSEGTTEDLSEDVEIGHSEYNIEMFAPYPNIIKWYRSSKSSMTICWEPIDVSGYEVQYSDDKDFADYFSAIIDDPSISTKHITGLKDNTKYYVRMRSYIALENNESRYSEWSYFDGRKDELTLSPTLIRKGAKGFELRTQAKQKLYDYDILQGSCTDGKYLYYILYHKKKEKCKIVKVRLSGLKVVKVSKALSVSHGNDMVYNPLTKKLVVVHSTKKTKRVSIVNPSSLKIERNIDVVTPASVTGFSGLAFNSLRNQYIAYTKKDHDFLVMDANFRVVDHIILDTKMNTTYQGMDANNDYVFVSQSPKAGTGQKYNTISVYDWDGEYLYNINVFPNYELESIYHIGNTYYGGFYKEYYQTKYKYKTKKVKVKWKKVKGKWKYKYKKKRVKVAYKKYGRTNYIYKLGVLE